MQSTKTTIIITTAILLLTILGAGCTDTGGANPETVKYTPPPQEVAVVEETAAEEPVPEPTVKPWYVDRVGFEDAQVGTYSTLFNTSLNGVKTSMSGGSYDLFDTKTADYILNHREWNPSQLRLDLELSSDQYRTLIDQYGDMISVTMETIDLDQDGAMDKVAVKYVGTDGEFTHESNNAKKGLIRLIEDYMDS